MVPTRTPQDEADIPRPAGRPPVRRRAGRLAAAAALAAAGWALSTWRLGVPSWSGDEPIYVRAGRAYWRGDFQLNPEHPPLVKYAIGAALSWFGEDRLGAARVPSAMALFSVGLLLWAWLRRVGPRGAGPVAAVLVWTLPVLTTFPEALDRAPDSAVAARSAMLDPVAGALIVAALAAGWWWARAGRLPAAAACGALSGLAVGAKLPAVLALAVPAAWGVAAAALRPGAWPARTGRAAAHGAVWVLSAAAVFAACYAPMGGRQAVHSFARGWQLQRTHGAAGHTILVAGRPEGHGPWWITTAWQTASWGPSLTVAAAFSILGGLAARSALTAYLAAAAAAPMLLLAPATGLALPHYLLLWRPTLIAAAVVGATATIAVARRDRLPWPIVAALVAALAAPAAVSATGSAWTVATLAPTGYGKLPELVVRPGRVWILADKHYVQPYLPRRRLFNYDPGRPPTDTPAAIVLDRGNTLRAGDDGLAAWAAARGYRMVRTGPIDVWLAP